MLKFFRLYNKWILVVGCSVLMVAFLLPNATDFLAPSQEGRPVGRLSDGRNIRIADQANAHGELALYSQLGPVGYLAGTMLEGSDRDLHWALIKIEAQRMGLAASATEIQMVMSLLGLEGDTLVELARRFNTTERGIRAAIGNWLVAEKYRDLVIGRSFESQMIEGDSELTASSSPGIQRLLAMRQIFALENQIRQSQPDIWQLQYFSNMLQGLEYRALYGTQRLSEPIFRATVQDQSASAGGRLLLIPATKFAKDVAEPTSEELAAQFEAYRDQLPGMGEHGFGYKQPDRVKLEYLTIPMHSAREAVRITEAETLAHFEQNKQRYTSFTESGETTPMTYAEARERVRSELRGIKARALVDQVLQAALGKITDSQRALTDDQDDRRYKLLPEGYTPLSFQDLAQDLSQQFGVAVTAERRDGAWLGIDELQNLPGIGGSIVADSSTRLDFATYVQSAWELEPDDADPTTTFRLQKGVVSRPLVGGIDGSTYLFRLTDVKAEHELDDYTTIKDQVAADVRHLKAYRRLADDAALWKASATTKGLDALATELELTVGRIGPIEKRQSGRVPSVAGIGEDQKLIDSMFDQAIRLAETGELESLPISSRLLVSPIDGQLKLAIVELNSYEPVTRNQYAFAVQSPDYRAAVSRQLVPFTASNPLSLDSVKHRLGFVARDEGSKKADGDAEGSGEAENE